MVNSWKWLEDSDEGLEDCKSSIVEVEVVDSSFPVVAVENILAKELNENDFLNLGK
jgi:hypothetical protein